MSKWKNLTKRGLSLFMALVMCAGLLQLSAFAAGGAAGAWDGITVAEEFAGGDGKTEETAFQIETGAQLAYLAQLVNGRNNINKNEFFKLTADIDLNNQLWTPIGKGSGGNAFQGRFIGNGHTIKNLKVSNGSASAGLFGYTADAVICDMTIDNATVSGGDAGAFAGTVANSKLCNLHVRNATVKGSSGVGGIVGQIASASGWTTTVCCSSTDSSGISVSQSFSSTNHAGGIVGEVAGSGGKAYIERCWSGSNSVQTGAGFAGGILGSNCKNTTSTGADTHIIDCYNKASVKSGGPVSGGKSGAGGIAGYLWHSGAEITACYNTGNVTVANSGNAKSPSNGGGITGYGTALTYDHVFNFGQITAPGSTTSASKPNLGSISGYTGGTVNYGFSVNPWTSLATNKYNNKQNGQFDTKAKLLEELNIAFKTRESWILSDGQYPTLKRCVPEGADECTCQNDHYYYDSGDRKYDCGCYCAPHEPTVEPKHLTDITKELMTKADAEAAGLSVTGVTYPVDGKVTASGETVTLLYKITVTGDEGAAYIVTDEGAEWVSGGDAHEVKTENEKQVLYVTGTLGEGETEAVIYVTKTFTVEEAGKVTNTACLAPGDDNTDLDPKDPSKIEDGKLPVTSDPVDVTPAATPTVTDFTKELVTGGTDLPESANYKVIREYYLDGVSVAIATSHVNAAPVGSVISVADLAAANPGWTYRTMDYTGTGMETYRYTFSGGSIADTSASEVMMTANTTPPTITLRYDVVEKNVTKPDGLDAGNHYTPTAPTWPDNTGKVTIPAGGSVNLLYKLTVTGDAGAAYKVEDEGAAWVGGDPMEGTIPEGGEAVIYVTRTFTAADIDQNGKVVNEATVNKGKEDEKPAEETTDAEEEIISNPKLTGITKTQLDEAPAGVTLPDGVTLSREDAGKYVADADGKVTLLYQITVTGEKDAKYIVTDDGATRVGGAEMTGTLGEEDAVIYVVKTFTKDQVQKGQVTNTAYVKPDGDKTDLNPSDPDKKPDDDGKLPSDPVNTDVTPASYDLEVKKTMEDSRASNIPENEEWVTFTVTVTNNSNQPLYNLMLVDTMDKTLEFVPETIQVQVTGNDGNTNKVEFKGTEEFLEPVRNDKDRIVWNAEGGVTRKTDGEKKWDSTWTLAGAFQPNAVLTLTYDARILYGDAATVEFYNYADALAGTKPDDQPKYDGDQIAEMRAGGSLQMDLIHYEFIGGGSGSVGSGSGGSGPIGETRTKYKLTYDFAGGMLGNASSYVDQTKGLTAASHTFYVDGNIQPEREGFTFVGWTNQAGTATYPAGEEIIVLRSSPERTIYAKWTPKQPDTVTVTFNPNGGSWGGITDSLTRSTTKGGTLTNVPTNPTKGDDLFLGWFTAADNSGVKVDDPATAIFDKDTTLYAHWQTRYTYTLNCYDGGTQLAGSPHTYGPTTDTAHTFAVTNPSKTGFTFQGWAETEDGEVVYTPAEGATTVSITLTSTASEKDVYAVWEKDPDTVTVNWVNGTETVQTAQVPESEITEDDNRITVDHTYPTDPTDQGHWDDPVKNPDGSITIAWVDETEYTVTYDWGDLETDEPVPVDPNGGYTKGSSVRAMDSTVEQKIVDGVEYIFAGWTLSTTGRVVSAGSTFAMPGENVVLTAFWAKRTVSEEPEAPALPTYEELRELEITVVVECDNPNHTGARQHTMGLLENSYDLVQDKDEPTLCTLIIKPALYQAALGDDHTYVNIANQVITLNFVPAGQVNPAMLEEVQEDLEIPEVTLPEIPAQEENQEDTILPEESDSQEEVLVEPSLDLEGNKTLEEQTEENADLEENTDLQESEDTQEPETIEGLEVYNANAPEGSWVLADGADSVTVTVTVHCDAAAPETDYTLSYNANGGNGTLPPSQTVTAPSGSAHMATVGSGNGLTLSGYTFQGWSTSPNSGVVNYRPGASINLTSDVMLYAVWTQNTPTTPTTPPTGGNNGGNGGSGGGGGGRPGTSPTRPGNTTTIGDTDVPLAGDLQLNKTDHFAYIKGYQDGTVRPNNPITRAQVATIFYRLLDETSRVIYFQETNDFTDVTNDYWANKAISTLTNAGIITGFSDGTFRPNAYITRAQFAAIAARFDNVVPGLNNPFTDVAEDYWARDLIAFAADRGWITGNGGKFRPLENITRVEVMDFINNVLERHVDEQGLLENAAKWSDVPVTDPNYYVVEEATNSHDYTRRTEGQLMENWTQLNPDPVWDE